MPRKKGDKILIEFGNILKERRKVMGLSIRQFAAQADMDHAMVNNYERGIVNPRFTTLKKLAAAYGVELWELLKP